MEAGSKAVIYLRVSTHEQGVDGLGVEAQRATCMGYCDAQGWVVQGEHVEVVSGAAQRRPVLEAALEAVPQGGVLVVSRVDRLARGLGRYVRLIERAASEGWSIVSADGALDLTTPTGRAMAGMAAVFAELERDLTSARTKEALAAARARGVQLGRPGSAADRPEVVTWIRRQRERGVSLARISEVLNDRGEPGPAGGRWYPSSVSRYAKP